MSTENEILSDLVQYSAWASKKLLDFSLTVPEDAITREIGNSHGGILKTFQHLYYGDRIWLARLHNSTGQMEDPAPGPSLADLDRVWWPMLNKMAEYAASTDPALVVPFRRLNGDSYSLEAGQIIRHVVNHGTYHRGQIAAMLRQSGFVPPSTDLLFYQLAPR